MSFYQILNWLKYNAGYNMEISVHFKNGKVWNNSTYDRDFGKSDGYFKVFGQLYYLLPGVNCKTFTPIRDTFDVRIYEL